MDPSGGTPAELIQTGDPGLQIWQVRWDNPVVGDTSFEVPFPGGALAKANTWRYDNFDLEANWTAFGDAAFGFEEKFGQFAWPQFEGSYDTFLPWEVHGLRLQPRISGDPIEALATVQAVRDDCTTGSLPYKGVGYFQLAPDVALVPIRVVVFDPTPAADLFSPGWVSQKDAELLFDDIWVGQKDKTNSPSCSPDAVDAFWKHRAGCEGGFGCETVVQASGSASSKIIQPDRVWDQCGVQFRLVGYHQCTIDAREFAPIESPDDGFCGDIGMTARVNSLILRARQCGVPQDPTAVVQVMFVRDLVPRDCNNVPVGAQNESSVLLSLAAYQGSGLVLSHELGHRLGLPHASNCNSGLLMCEFANALGNIVPLADCATAHDAAMRLQQNFWGGP